MSVEGIPVLSYHSIYDQEHKDLSDSVSVSLKSFSAQMQWLHRNGYKTISIDDINKVLSGEEIRPGKYVQITFDDGYQSLYKYALQILSQYGFTATLFLSTSFIGRYYTQPDFNYVRHDRQLTWPEIRQLLQCGWNIQSHGYTHPRLTHLEPQAIAKQLCLSKEIIEYNIGRAVCSFAYPYGIYNTTVVDLLKEFGYTSAYSVHSGKLYPSSAMFQLPRIMIHNRDNMDIFKRKVTIGDESAMLAFRSRIRNIAFATPQLKDFVEHWMHRMGYGNR